MGTELAARPSGLVAVGLLHPDLDEGTGVPVRLTVDGSVMRAGRGPIAIDVDAAGYVVTGGTLVWIVTTNKGWAHLRGTAWADDPGMPRPFRADLYSADAVGDPGVDRFAFRLYGVEDDPNVASPTHKIHGWLDARSIRLGRAR